MDIMQVSPITNVPFTGEDVEITNLTWNFDESIITVYSRTEEKILKVIFNNEFGPCSLRLLDESDLNENWQDFNMSDAWIYKVNSGGWFDQESAREGFLLQHSAHIYKEYLIIGLDACVSVFTKEDVVVLVESNSDAITIST